MTLKIPTLTKIGLLIATALFILIYGVSYLKGIDIFKKQHEYYIVYEKVEGLIPSSSVLISGFKIGQVCEIEFKKNKRILVTIAVDNEYSIPKGSVARIYSADLMGSRAIELLVSDSTTMHISGDTLQAAIEQSLKDQVSLQMMPLKNQAEDLMKEIEDAVKIINSVFNEQTRNNLSKSFDNLEIAIKHLKSTSYLIDTLVQSENKKLSRIFDNVEAITTNFKNNNEKLTFAINNISSISDSIAKSNLKNTIEQTSETMLKVNNIVEKINTGEGTLGMLLNNDTLYYNIEDAAYNMNKLVEDLRINPKRYIHFSLFDMGKTVYEVDADLNKKSYLLDDKVSYQIQIITSNSPIPLNPDNFKGLKNVQEFVVSGTYIYTIGNKNKLVRIMDLYEEVKVKYPDSFIVIFKAGENVPIRLNK